MQKIEHSFQDLLNPFCISGSGEIESSSLATPLFPFFWTRKLSSWILSVRSTLIYYNIVFVYDGTSFNIEMSENSNTEIDCYIFNLTQMIWWPAIL